VHLSHSYAKLGIRTRAQLPSALAPGTDRQRERSLTSG
jgi:hypothetical protein